MKEKNEIIPKRCIREIRCPLHQKLLGKYDARYGLRNAVYFCPKCKKERILSYPAERIEKK